MVSDVLDPEVAVRSYLLLLDDPTKLVDQQKIEGLELAVAAASDPIDKLKALADLEHARDVDALGYQQAFIRHARKWATEHNIPASSFQQLGVSDDTLQAAGLLTSARASSSRRSRGGNKRARTSSAVTAEEIKAHVLKLTTPFTLADLARTVGGSPMTLRKAISELTADGRVVRLGTDPNHTGRGRAPMVFATSGPASGQ